MGKLRLAIVIGSVRPNRFGGHAAHWIDEVARRRGDFEVELIDLKDYPMPLFAEEASPLYAPSKDEVARRWQKKVGEFDAFILTAAEYNRGPTAVLKNALDYGHKGSRFGETRSMHRHYPIIRKTRIAHADYSTLPITPACVHLHGQTQQSSS
jgi:NAD(P)H-dependent FMN reductase